MKTLESSFSIDKLTGPLELRIWIRGDEDIVARCWTSGEELQNWFLIRAEHRDAMGDLCDAVVEGGSFHWEWLDGTEDLGDFSSVGRNFVELGWYGGRLRVSWEQDGGEVLVKVRQELFQGSIEERAQIQYGWSISWTFWLSNLKCWVENGIDLRETNPSHRVAVNV